MTLYLLAALFLIAVLGGLMLCVTGDGLRDRFLRALVLSGVAVVAITETLSALNLIQRGPLIVCWLLVLAATLIAAKRKNLRLVRTSLHFDPVVIICAGCVAVILTLTAVTAAFSPPNSADAMAYHMPRIVYWAEQLSVRFFPTPYFNQIMLQPLAEYMMLHTYVLSGGDRLINFVQWFASLASIIGVSAVARWFGATGPAQAMAALFCATIPAGILASSGAKNDYCLAVWLVAAVYFALCYTRTRRLPDVMFMGAAFGLALLTKGTAYLFIVWPLAAVFVARARRPVKQLAIGALLAIALGLTLNAPQYMRNYHLSHSIMGFDSAQGDGVYRWRNETFGWKQTASNILRNLSEQLGARSAAWNQRVYSLVIAVHERLGIEVNSPATTWPGTSFAPPRNANHEADAPNRWHLAIMLVISGILLVSTLRTREFERSLYLLSLGVGFIAFCAYLKWQPFMGRLFLPLFVLASPLAGFTGERRRVVQLAICLFLLSNARLPLVENWVRPLKGPKSVLHTPRDVQYFADMTQWNNQASYFKAVDVLANSKCETAGIDITNLQLEYPLQALLRERKSAIGFVHAGVQNASARYAPPIGTKPCAIACLDCAADPKRLQLYSDFPENIRIGNFVIFLSRIP